MKVRRDVGIAEDVNLWRAWHGFDALHDANHDSVLYCTEAIVSRDAHYLLEESRGKPSLDSIL